MPYFCGYIILVIFIFSSKQISLSTSSRIEGVKGRTLHLRSLGATLNRKDWWISIMSYLSTCVSWDCDRSKGLTKWWIHVSTMTGRCFFQELVMTATCLFQYWILIIKWANIKKMSRYSKQLVWYSQCKQGGTCENGDKWSNVWRSDRELATESSVRSFAEAKVSQRSFLCNLHKKVWKSYARTFHDYTECWRW